MIHKIISASRPFLLLELANSTWYTSTICDVSSTLSFVICHDNQFYVQNVITCQCRHWIFSLTQLAELERIRQITIRTCIWMFFMSVKHPTSAPWTFAAREIILFSYEMKLSSHICCDPIVPLHSPILDTSTGKHFNPVLKCPIVSPAIFQVEDCLIHKHGPWYITILSVNLVYVASLWFSFVSLRF